MKLLLITAIQEFEKEVKNILNHSGVKAFSYQEVKGYKNESDGSLDNWFVSSRTEFRSLLFTVFVEAKMVHEIHERVEKFNAEQESQSHIHLVTLQIEKTV